MLLTCDKCGKKIEASLEELAVSGGVVVCPQCLNEFEAGVELPPAVPASAAPEARFCGECGQRLPASELRFCPYCGVRLLPPVPPVAAPVEATPPVVPSVGVPVVPSGRQSSLRFDVPLIRGIPLDYEREMGSPTFRRVSYFIIVVLLAVFVCLLIGISQQQ